MTTPQPEAPRPSVAGLPLALDPAATHPFTDAFLVDHDNMEPSISRGSIGFLAGPGYKYGGVFFFPTLRPGDLRRVQAGPPGYLPSTPLRRCVSSACR